MSPKDAAKRLKEKFPDKIAAIEEFKGEVTLKINKEDIVEVFESLKKDFGFDLLIDLCSVHYPEEIVPFQVIYLLGSTKDRVRLCFKVPVEEADDGPPSITGVYAGADWPEREAFDLMGLKFRGHPDLKRILTAEDIKGYPLRKDFPLRG